MTGPVGAGIWSAMRSEREQGARRAPHREKRSPPAKNVRWLFTAIPAAFR